MSKKQQTEFGNPDGDKQPVQADQAILAEPSKKFNKKAVFLTILATVLIVAGAVLGYLHFHKTSKPSSASSLTSSTSSSVKAASAYSTALVFQPSINTSSSTTAITDLDGNVTHSFNSNATSNTYSASGFSMENIELLEGSFLITTDNSWSSLAILAHDGKTTNAASSLTSLLAGNARPNSTNLSSAIASGKNTLFALERSPGSIVVKLVKIDVLAGANTTLLTADAIKQEGPGYTPLQLITVSPDGEKAYLISNDAKLDSTTASGASLVICDTSTGKFTTKALPDGVYPQSASVSKDGKLVAYIGYGSHNGYGTATTHIFNLDSGKDITVPQESLLNSWGANDVRFSPDGAYISIVGNYAADAKKAGMALQIISTATNTVVHQVNMVGVQNLVTGFDWSSNDNMIYATNSSNTGKFDVSKEAVHRIDASTGKVFDFPRTLGGLDAVLNFQQ